MSRYLPLRSRVGAQPLPEVRVIRCRTVIAVLSALTVSAVVSGSAQGTDAGTALSTGTGSAHARPVSDVRQLLAAPRFEVNRGQFGERVDFAARGVGYAVSLSRRGAE